MLQETPGFFAGWASSLSKAFGHATDGTRAYDRVEADPGQARVDLRREIGLEIKRQRRWLQDVEMVIGPKITRQKLDMLPKSIEKGESE